MFELSVYNFEKVGNGGHGCQHTRFFAGGLAMRHPSPHEQTKVRHYYGDYPRFSLLTSSSGLFLQYNHLHGRLRYAHSEGTEASYTQPTIKNMRWSDWCETTAS
jgi:hypothetical protein